MYRSRHINLALLLVAVLVVPMTMPASSLSITLSQEKENKKTKAKSKEEKKEEKPKLSKEEREYQKIKKFSLDLYLKDADFRNSVEEAYLRQQREHSEYAYYINTRSSAIQHVTRDGDKLRVEYALYDNPLAQDYINRVGQSLVPADSKRLYSFRIILNPIPESRALSTGTVYVSTGLLSLIDNEAQLAYVLGHEIGHVEKDHWKEDIYVAQGIQPYNEKQARKRAIWGFAIAATAGAIAGASGGSAETVATTMLLAAHIAPSVLKLVMPNAIASWDRLQEDEADELGLKYMLDRSYDVREVPTLYANMRQTSDLDPRVRLGFIADKERMSEREEQVKSLIGNSSGAMQKTLYVGAANLGPGKALNPSRDAAARAAAAEKTIAGQLSPDIRAKLDSGELIGTTAEFEAVMAGINRDNGIRAYYFDMFGVARENLEESLRIRSNDPYAHYYYGKILKLTARSSQEKLRALSEFAQAIQLDKRRVIAEPYLYRALSMIDTKDPTQTKEIIANLKDYVSIYQRENSGRLPPHMEVIYDYMQEVGETQWVAIPAVNVSTKNIDAIVTKAATDTGPSVPVERTSPTTENQPQRTQPTQRSGTRRP